MIRSGRCITWVKYVYHFFYIFFRCFFGLERNCSITRIRNRLGDQLGGWGVILYKRVITVVKSTM